MTEQITEKQARERLVNADWTQGEVEEILRELFPPVPREFIICIGNISTPICTRNTCRDGLMCPDGIKVREVLE